jgi:geranylgeranyl transferase type-2 subunit beta
MSADMASATYLQELTTRLADGLARLPDAARARHVAFVHARQNADGGFPGREGGSDLYYTGFALRALAALDGLTPEVAAAAAGFLRDSLARQASVVDFFSLLYACLLLQAWGGLDVLADSPPDWPERVAATLETFRIADGGYAKTAGGASGSTYHTFLVGLCYQLLGRALPRPDEVARFVHGRRRDDGGFVEIAPMRRSGTNPTAAAVGVLQLLAGEVADAALWPPGDRDGVVTFLAGMPSPEGGLRANGRAPLADLLSTFTGAWTLHQLGALDRLDAAAVRRYAQELEMPDGSFRGGLWDDGTDVEYTFYGLGVLGLLV